MFARVENGVTKFGRKKTRQHFRSETTVFNGEFSFFWPRKSQLLEMLVYDPGWSLASQF